MHDYIATMLHVRFVLIILVSLFGASALAAELPPAGLYRGTLKLQRKGVPVDLEVKATIKVMARIDGGGKLIIIAPAGGSIGGASPSLFGQLQVNGNSVELVTMLEAIQFTIPLTRSGRVIEFSRAFTDELFTDDPSGTGPRIQTQGVYLLTRVGR